MRKKLNNKYSKAWASYEFIHKKKENEEQIPQETLLLTKKIALQ